MIGRRGWCPDAHRPLRAGDGWLMRVKPPLGRLDPAMARAICDISDRCGNGVIEVTARGNLQLRGIDEARLDEARIGLIDCGATAQDAETEARRNIIVSPLVGTDPRVHTASHEVARVAERCLCDSALPPKFGIVVDGGGVFELGPCAGGVRLALRGSVCVLAAADETPPSFIATLTEAVGRIMRVSRSTCESPKAPTPPGVLSYGEGQGLVLIPAYGQTDAVSVRNVADAGGTLSLAPSRRIVIADASAGLPGIAAEAGFVTTSDDPRLRVIACPGAPACVSGRLPARAIADRIALHTRQRVHVSGCGKGCAHPSAADITLVGEDGGYALVRGGRASDRPVARGLALEACLDALRETVL